MEGPELDILGLGKPVRAPKSAPSVCSSTLSQRDFELSPKHNFNDNSSSGTEEYVGPLNTLVGEDEVSINGQQRSTTTTSRHGDGNQNGTTDCSREIIIDYDFLDQLSRPRETYYLSRPSRPPNPDAEALAERIMEGRRKYIVEQKRKLYDAPRHLERSVKIARRCEASAPEEFTQAYLLASFANPHS